VPILDDALKGESLLFLYVRKALNNGLLHGGGIRLGLGGVSSNSFRHREVARVAGLDSQVQRINARLPESLLGPLRQFVCGLPAPLDVWLPHRSPVLQAAHSHSPR